MSEQQYNNAKPIVNKIMNADGTITTLSGEIPTNPVMQWLNAKPIFNKLLEPDGSIGVFPQGGSTGTGGDFPEAPNNGNTYARKNRAWIETVDKNTFDSSIVDINGEIDELAVSRHEHDNKPVLDKLNEANGQLIFNNLPIEGKNGADGKNGVDGERGKSAYEIALENGFIGTEQEWLETLKGENGVSGIDGTNGIDGKSPTISIGETITSQAGTQAKVENIGTETDVILSFTIPQGLQGDSGESADPETLERIENLENTIGTLNDTLAARLAGAI